MKGIKQSSNSIAAGPDELTMLHPKHSGPRGYEFLTHICNLSLQLADILSIWKRATLIPIPKAGKPRHTGTFFRPNFLLFSSIKVFKRLLLLLFFYFSFYLTRQMANVSLHTLTTPMQQSRQQVSTYLLRPSPLTPRR